jgi:hypothetical protein
VRFAEEPMSLSPFVLTVSRSPNSPGPGWFAGPTVVLYSSTSIKKQNSKIGRV